MIHYRFQYKSANLEVYRDRDTFGKGNSRRSIVKFRLLDNLQA